MDDQLKKFLDLWHDQIEVLQEIERKYYILDASEKSYWGELFLKAEGKNIPEKEAVTYSSKEWKDFKYGWAVAKSEYNKEKRQLELQQKAFDAAYLSLKIESDAIRKIQ